VLRSDNQHTQTGFEHRLHNNKNAIQYTNTRAQAHTRAHLLPTYSF